MTDPTQAAASDVKGECPHSLRTDGNHGWLFDGDDPYIYCCYCGELRDAISGKVIG